jgi:hypothetical protein
MTFTIFTGNTNGNDPPHSFSLRPPFQCSEGRFLLFLAHLTVGDTAQNLVEQPSVAAGDAMNLFLKYDRWSIEIEWLPCREYVHKQRSI